MSFVRLTAETSQVAVATATFQANAPAGTTVLASISTIRGLSPATQQHTVPASEFWYITSFYLPAGVSPSAVNAIVFTFVNDTQQPLAPAESEIQQNIYNKLKLSPAQWLKLPPAESWYMQFQSQVANGSSATTVTINFTILRVPLGKR